MMTTTTSSGVGGAGGLAEFSFLALTLKVFSTIFYVESPPDYYSQFCVKLQFILRQCCLLMPMMMMMFRWWQKGFCLRANSIWFAFSN